MDVCRPALHVLFFPPLIVNNARENDVSRGQMDGDVNARHPDAAGISRWPSHLRSCGVCGRRRDRVRVRERLARARRMIGFQNRSLVSRALCEIRPTSKFCPLGGWWPTPSILLLLPLAGSA